MCPFKALPILIAFVMGVVQLSAQVRVNPDPETETVSDTTRPQEGILENIVDTAYKPQTYVIAADFYHRRPVLTDSMNHLTHQYDDIRKVHVNHAHLGNLGSPQRSRMYVPLMTKGLELGQNQFDLYRGNFASFRFFDSETPITQFNYAQGISQQDAKFDAVFGKNFDNGVKASLEYRRINQFGQFSLQRVKNTVFGVGIWFDSPDGKYDGLYHYASNSFVQQDNGGIADYEQLDTISQRDIAFINLTGAQTTHRQRAYSVQNHFHVRRANDSLFNPVLIDIIHTGQFKNGFIKFADEDISEDGGYYDDFLVDARGVRHFIDYYMLDNRLDVQFRFGTPAQYDISRHVLRAGIQYRTSRIDQEPETTNYNEVFLNASGRFTFYDRLDLFGRGYIQLAGQTGDFLIDSRLKYLLDREGGHVSLGFVAYSRSPTIIERKFYVTQQLIWSNDFKKPGHTELNIIGNVPRWNLYAKASFIGLVNNIYYDQLRKPQQFDGTHGILQLAVTKEFRIQKFGTIGTIALQKTPDELRLPSVIVKAQLYFTDYWFRDNLKVRFGADLRITDTHAGSNYFPLTGQFHLDDSRLIDAYPNLDMFLDFEIRETFRAFLKFENFTAWWDNGPYMHVIDYPQFNRYFRFGFWMKLFN